MTRAAPAVVGPDMPICEAAAMMVNGTGGVLPVVVHDRIEGLLTWREIVSAAVGGCAEREITKS